MKQNIGIGIQSFDKMIEGNYFYIDKTHFIKEWWECGDDVTLITRPRRFGKSLNMSMLHSFFSVDYKDRGDLFEGLSIWENEKYQKLQGTYPVINLSFARVKETDYEKTKEKIYEILRNEFIRFSYVRNSEALTDADRDTFDRILSKDTKETEATSALYQLSNFLYRYYGKKVIILLDEYDTPMQEAYVKGFWEDMVAFTRSLFNSTFKTNPSLERGIMTGITRVSKESIFSDLNNPKVVTTTSDEYATAFGFTEEETFQALEKYGYGEKKEEIKWWYDGFVFGKERDIYNPWSILNFLDTGKIETYWANTSSNSLVGKLIREGDEEIKEQFGILLNGESIHCSIDEQIVYNQLNDNPDAVWSLLLASGYLKVLWYQQLGEVSEYEDPQYELTFTNQEVRRMFRGMVREWFKGTKKDYNGFIRALLMQDVDEMNEFMNRIAQSAFSYFDVGGGESVDAPERFYHGLMLGLLVELQEEYVVTSNQESGFGRYDVMMEPKDRIKDAFILEFKLFRKQKEKSLEDTLANAHAQIEEKQYEAALLARGIAKEKIHKYGFAFEGKKVLIG